MRTAVIMLVTSLHGARNDEDVRHGLPARHGKRMERIGLRDTERDRECMRELVDVGVHSGTFTPIQ